jgi:hypothetical protein
MWPPHQAGCAELRQLTGPREPRRATSGSGELAVPLAGPLPRPRPSLSIMCWRGSKNLLSGGRRQPAIITAKDSRGTEVPVGGCVAAPHGWNLTEISVRLQTQPSQGNKFDAGLPRSAKFSKGRKFPSPVSKSQSQAGFGQGLTDCWDSEPEDPFPSFRTSRGSHLGRKDCIL